MAEKKIDIKEEQKKYSLDKITVKKISKGACIAGTGAAALFVLDALKIIQTGPYAPVIALLVPTLTNMIREWMKGK